jgi:Cd2+/Zn2+-exporting ATPase/Cu+-exporting ATPase
VELKTTEVLIQGMDCAECTQHVHRSINRLPGVSHVEVFLTSEKAVIQLEPDLVSEREIHKAIRDAGYEVATAHAEGVDTAAREFTRPVLTLLGIVFGAVLFVVVVGEWLGLFERVTQQVPWYIALLLIVLLGYPVFRKVLKAALQRQIISHTLMAVGVIAACIAGEWATAVVLVFFMRVGDYVEGFTAERARRAVKDLAAMAPQTARVQIDTGEIEIPIGEVKVGDTVIVRPGESIPVDGEVIAGHATIDQSSINGEAMPVEAGPGAHVFAATVAQLGSLRVRTLGIGTDTTFGKVVQLVEEAEAHRANVQRVADKFSSYYLPVVLGIAALTLLIRRDPVATVAVLVVACSCAFALATPIAMLASIGAGAKHGLLIKGGKYLETLAGADVLLIDKTGTLTLGQPQIVKVLVNDNGWGIVETAEIKTMPAGNLEFIHLAATAERYSEHPLAEAARRFSEELGFTLAEPDDFRALPGVGVQAKVAGKQVVVGKQILGAELSKEFEGLVAHLLGKGATLIYVYIDGNLKGVLAAQDTLRPEVPRAIEELVELGFSHVELLTGDNSAVAADLAKDLEVSFQAELLPEDKIRVVKEYQSQGHTVVMVGDGVNDAPALAQADVGIAMGAAGSDVAIEAAHIALLRDDWTLVPDVVRIAQRTMRVVKMNIGFTAVYNLVGLTLAAFGYLPPVFAAAVQSIPDLGILANSSRLLRQK